MIHLNNSSQDKFQLTEEEFEIQKALLPKDTLFWKKGMTGWERLFKESSPPPLPNGGGYTGTPKELNLKAPLEPLLPTANWLRIALIAFLVTSLAFLVGMGLLPTEPHPIEGLIILAMLGFQLISFLLCAILFTVWTHKANKNCHSIGVQNMKFSPGLACGSYYIPIANLFMPFQATNEIWKISEYPQNWQDVSSSSLLTIWWAAWIAGNIAASVGNKLSPDGMLIWHSIGLILQIVSAIAAIKITQTVSYKQGNWKTFHKTEFP